MKLVCLLGLALAGTAQVRVSGNQRYLVREDGKPFFWLGDTAWELFHRLNREDAALYLDTRAKQGFTVIQAVVLAELDGLDTPNAYGEKPLFDRDPTRPNEKYFTHVDWVLSEAAKRGLTIAMLPTWGNKVLRGTLEKGSDIVFNEENAEVYGKWIGARYRESKNLIWVLGGDRRLTGTIGVWRAMARGLQEGDSKRHLITFHPNGNATSSAQLQDDAWLAFNMIQSGHTARDKRNDEMIRADWDHKPTKPVLDGEPRYENHPVNWEPEELGWFDDYDVRQAAYFALLSGAFGHTYGCHDVWQFLEPGREAVGFARGSWRTSLTLPGARQMGIARKFFEQHDPASRIPAQDLLAAAGPVAARGDRYIMVYLPNGGPLRLNLADIPGRKLRAQWFNPRTGQYQPAQKADVYQAPGEAKRGNDWVLLLTW